MADILTGEELDNKTALPLVLFGYSDGVGSVTGTAFDATSVNREPLSDVTVCFFERCDLTDSEGSYLIEDIPDGLHRLSASRIDFYDVVEEVVVKPLETAEQDFALLPLSEITDVFMRVLLTWNETETWPPDDVRNDLDAHLWLAAPDPPTHVDFVDRGDCTTFPNACLEVDYQKGFGPETLAIRNLESTVYYYGVLNYYAGYNGVPDITDLGAKVRLYQEGGKLLEYDVPTSGEGDFWYVFQLISDGDTATVVEMNCITAYSGDPPECAPSEPNTTISLRPLK
jgi:adhesin/invasin